MKQLLYTLATVSALSLIGCTDAGKDQTAVAGTKVTLDASDSKTDMGGTITRYTWTQLEQNGIAQVHLFDKYSATPSFIAPKVTTETDIRFKVVTTESYNCKTEQDSSCRHHKSSSKVTVTITPSGDSNSTSSSDGDRDNNGIYAITATGKITTAKNQAISGALVSANGKSRTTKSDGKYSLTSVQAQDRVVIEASHPDYFANSRVILVNRDNAFSQNIQLFKPQTAQNFDTQEGTTVSQGGASISFAADVKYLNSEKKTYKGNATVKLSYYTIDSASGKAALSGGYEGSDASETFPLAVHGFVNLSLEDDKGNPLTLASNSVATLSFPATKSTNNEPKIPLWTYDASSGYWLEDTSTEVVNGAYVAEISQIAAYGLHTRAPQATLHLCVEDALEQPISGVNISVSTSKWSSNLAQTDSDGELTLNNVVANTALTINASKVVNGKTQTKNYTSTVLLSEGETRDLVDCIVLESEADRAAQEQAQKEEKTQQTQLEKDAVEARKKATEAKAAYTKAQADVKTAETQLAAAKREVTAATDDDKKAAAEAKVKTAETTLKNKQDAAALAKERADLEEEKAKLAEEKAKNAKK